MRAEIWTLEPIPLVVEVDDVFCQGHLCHLVDDTGLETRMTIDMASPGGMWVFLNGPYAGMARRILRYSDSEWVVLDAGIPRPVLADWISDEIAPLLSHFKESP